MKTKPVSELELHEVHEMIPDMGEKEYESLKQDIKENGVMEPIRVDPDDTNVVLDGRHRLKVAKELSINELGCEEANLDNNSPTEYAVKSALLRRHLSKGQKAMLAAEVKPKFEEEAKKRQGERTDLKEDEHSRNISGKSEDKHENESATKAGSLFGVSGRTVQKAEKIKEAADENPDGYGDLKESALRSVHSAYSELKRRKEREERSKKVEKLPEVKNLKQGGCLEKTKDIEDDSIDCIITDPPYGYGLGENREAYTRMQVTCSTEDWDFENDDESVWGLLYNLFDVCDDKLKENSDIYIFTTWKKLHKLIPLVNEFWEVKNFIIWEKNSGSMGEREGYNYREYYEGILFAKKGKRRLNYKTQPKNILTFDRIPSQNRKHPTEKPISLLKKLISYSTVEGETVLDPFAGSGTTLAAAEELDRNWIGIELEERWYNTARERIAEVRRE